ncbi:cbb3-type cytochrome oxidase subunit 3 [Novilysobacter arseniciresistens]|uniref:cbb3-type cytochrome oxidase subunit 3 n=1 Tax=Novilysobacter arseniciresistens TaxID=1385522 RepID=UPI0009DF5F44|nr:cbb3-type cytochrome c oxidase subunit 3 [Lysobacter arseniciresistens]
MLSGIITIVLTLLFVAVWAWAWQPRHKQSFDATARLALDDDAPPQAQGDRESRA